ncbi:related to YIA6 - Pvruvate transporter of the mitochondrial inner membrane [Pseudozyma flocculosa]|uniref:Related to YIA6 - Pvruvate transporter of the mitochondrial inner membrane n=1 Tax=Pseudozyma flocculosa TaxID=84751 RepID=A0A5C3F2J0_9BASI|nr:related to YIA6 - Pvruvate transporter of the mitochondrial inner membrane [Pseudozyma flocculosa]
MNSSAIAGACAGLVSSVVTCPLDVVKTRLQAQEAVTAGDIAAEQGARYLGLADTLKRIWRDDGFRGFYRGLGPTIFGYLPTWAIYFTVYDSCKQVLAHDLSQSGEEDFLNHILSAMTAGAASTICTSPLWVVKTRFMLQSGGQKAAGRYRHTGDAFVQIFRTEGLRGFYKGLLPSLFGVSHVAVQFPLYEAFKGYARQATLDRGGGGGGNGELQPTTILACSSSAKMIASVTTYPHEVLRTRLQMQPRSSGSAGSTTTAATTRSAASPPTSSSSSSPTRMTAASTSAAAEGGAMGASAAAAGAGGAGAGAGSGGSTITKGKYSGLLQACKTIAREEGIRGFYKGMGVNLIRTVPSSALTILTYEVIMQHLTQDHAAGH